MAMSGVLHLLLTSILVLAVPMTETAQPSLRVRLVEESKEPASIIAQVPAPPPRPLPVRHRAPRLAASVRPTPTRAVVRDEPPVPPASPAAPAPTPTASRFTDPGTTGRPGGDGEAGRPPEEEVARSEGGRGAHSGMSDAGPPPVTEASESRSGVFLASGGGNGTGSAAAGSGAESGSGRKGFGVDHGETGEGSGTGPGRGGGGVASLGGRGGSGSGNGSSVADHLGVIRRQIEQAKVYPDAARREGMQGIVELRFRIAGDGSVEAIEVVRSSGHRLLDEISAQTVRRAGPYPILAGWIRVPLSYRLDR